jgi:L,D-transpeptidase-like protein/putative peptidoglycan binding protein
MDSRRGRRFCEILRGAVLLACLTAALVVSGSASASAPDVAALQVALRIRGTYSGGIDGIFGPETQAAVRLFQRRKGLIVDGDPGPRTRAAFGPFARHRLGSRLLRTGRFGWDVAALQHLLVRCGFAVGAIDGFFGPRTRTVVLRYQHRASLSVDGVAGAATIGGLRRALACRELRGTVPSGVTVSGVGVGGLSAHWASIALRSAFSEPLHLGARGRGWLADPNQFARAEVATAVRRALHAHAGQGFPLRVAVQRRRIRRYAARIDSRLCRPPVPARLLGLRSLRPSISRAHAGCRVRRARFIRALIRGLIPLERSVIHVPMKRVRPAVTRANFGPVIVIHRNSHILYLYRGVKLVRTVAVSTGRRSSPTPLGRFRIVTKARRPWWYPPASAWAKGAEPIPPGPGNPLGTRWMGLSAQAVGIHGTPDAASVGYSGSHGCVRMYRRQAEWLFRRVRIGTPVIIMPV